MKPSKLLPINSLFNNGKVRFNKGKVVYIFFFKFKNKN